MDPFTIAAGISSVGSLFKGVTSFLSGNAQASAERAAAKQSRAEAGVKSSQALAQGDAVAATAATQAAANGGGLDGSAMNIISSLGQQSMFNARSAIYRGETEARSDLYNANVDKAQGLQGLIGGTIGAAGSMFQGQGLSKLAAAQGSAADAAGDASSFLSAGAGDSDLMTAALA
jgi:hypothetical protein